jgi:nitrous oxide reductase
LPRQGQEDQRPRRDHDGHGRQGRHPVPGPGTEVAARRRRDAGRQVHRRLRQARHARVGVFSFEKIQAAIKAGKFESKDPYGIPVIGMKDALHTQVQLGLGPLHTQFDSKNCIAYTSLYVDSQVAKWNFCEGKVLDKISVHYNIGHLMTMEGDSMAPKGRYLVALNKLSIDRFNPVGPLHPQNHQLIDIANDKMQLLVRHAGAAG